MSSKKRKVIDLVEEDDSETENFVEVEETSETKNRVKVKVEAIENIVVEEDAPETDNLVKVKVEEIENPVTEEDAPENESLFEEEENPETEGKDARLENMKKHFNQIFHLMDELRSGALACPKKSRALTKALRNEAIELHKTNGPSSEAEEEYSSDDDDDDGISIDSTMNEKDRRWAQKWLQLRQYLIERGNSNVPLLFQENKSLGKWVSTQRTSRRAGRLSQERIDKLDRLSFSWGKGMPPTLSWDEMYQRLVHYRKEHENCNVPFNRTQPSALAKWMAYQRMEYKLWKKRRGTPLTPAKIRKLNDIDFNWKGPKMRG